MSFIRRQVGLRTDAASASGSMHGKIKELRTLVNTIANKPIVSNGSVVKAVQRGVSTVPSNNDSKGYTFTITITAVDPTKTFVLANSERVLVNTPSTGSDWRAAANIGVRATLINATTLEIKVRGIEFVDNSIVSWQVIEYY